MARPAMPNRGGKTGGSVCRLVLYSSCKGMMKLRACGNDLGWFDQRCHQLHCWPQAVRSLSPNASSKNEDKRPGAPYMREHQTPCSEGGSSLIEHATPR